MFKESIVNDLENKRDELKKEIDEINNRLINYRKGSLFAKNNYFYIKYYENGKVVSKYVGKNLSKEDIDSINRELKNHKTLQKRNNEYVKELKEIEKLIRKYGGKV